MVLSPSNCGSSDKIEWNIEVLLRSEDVKQLRKNGHWYSDYNLGCGVLILLFRPTVFQVVKKRELFATPSLSSGEEDGESEIQT